MYNDIIAGITIAGTFFTAGFAGAVWDFKRAQRKKAREQKIKLAYEALDDRRFAKVHKPLLI